MRPLILLATLAVAGGSYYLFTNLKSELAPIEDRGTILNFAMAPDGATAQFTDRYMYQIEGIVAAVPEQDRNFSIVGYPVVTQGFNFVGLTDWDDRERKQQAVTSELMPKLFGGIPGVLAFATNMPSLGQSPINRAVELVIMTTGSYEELQNIVNQVMGKARQNQALIGLDSDLKLNKPQVKVAVDRDKAAVVGVNIDTIGRTLETFLGGRQMTRFKRGADQYDVIVQVAAEDRSDPNDVSRIYVRGRNDAMIQLSNLVTLQETVAPRELNHFSKMRSATIQANLAPNYGLGKALAFLENAIKEVAPPSTQLGYKGQSREFKESGTSIYITFLLALAFIYLVLAAQFESFIDPLIIMFSVPLAIGGALLTLQLTGNTLNIYSQIGLITLVGLITKHGILIVEFANQLQEQGKEKLEAVVESAVLRLRPVLMTTGAMVLGAVPLAIASGAGAEGRQAIGWVIVGGMSFGTLLTLFVVPTIYSLVARNRHSIDESDVPIPATPSSL